MDYNKGLLACVDCGNDSGQFMTLCPMCKEAICYWCLNMFCKVCRRKLE